MSRASRPGRRPDVSVTVFIVGRTSGLPGQEAPSEATSRWKSFIIPPPLKTSDPVGVSSLTVRASSCGLTGTHAAANTIHTDHIADTTG